MHIIYKITYKPHLINKTPPYYYIGSKYNYKGKYYGSPSSSQHDWYTEGLSISDWWKLKVAANSEDFSFDIIETYYDISPSELVKIEHDIHISHDVKLSEDYFNMAIATKGWVSIPRTQKTKDLMSDIITDYWSSDSDAVKERKQNIIQYNKTHSSDKMKKLHKEHPEYFNYSKPGYKESQSRVLKSAWKDGKFDNRKPRKLLMKHLYIMV